MKDRATYDKAIIATKRLAELTRQKAVLLDDMVKALTQERNRL